MAVDMTIMIAVIIASIPLGTADQLGTYSLAGKLPTFELLRRVPVAGTMSSAI